MSNLTAGYSNNVSIFITNALKEAGKTRKEAERLKTALKKAILSVQETGKPLTIRGYGRFALNRKRRVRFTASRSIPNVMGEVYGFPMKHLKPKTDLEEVLYTIFKACWDNDKKVTWRSVGVFSIYSSTRPAVRNSFWHFTFLSSKVLTK